MSNYLKVSLGVLLLGSALSVAAKVSVPAYEKLPVFSMEGQHKTSCQRLSDDFTRAHFRIVDLNSEFANKVIDRYLEYLDYNRSLLTKDEVSSIYGNYQNIIYSISNCDLGYPMKLYGDALRKRYNKYVYFTKMLDKPLDLSKKESVELDRRKSEFLDSESAIRHEWELELKNEYLSQLLSDPTKTDAQVRDKLKKRYEIALSKLGQVNNEDAFSAFMNSFARAIDPHTSYFSPTDTESFNDDMNLTLEGIGAVLSSEDEYTVITEIMPGSPAERSKKLKPKDRIVRVTQQNGTQDDVIGMRLSDVVKKIRGTKGTKVTLDIERGEGSSLKTFKVELIRDKIRLQDREAKGEVKLAADGSRIGVITVKSFYSGLHDDLSREINKLKGENIKSLIIDLRNNGGGSLPEAIMSTGLFIKSGPVVIVRDVLGNELPQNDNDEGQLYDGPLVVLVNRLSASSSEIMAAALRDYGRALVVGDTTFGKGTVQQNKSLARVFDFADLGLGSVHYTIAKFYRINGGSTQLKGVSPDVAMPALVDDNEYGERNEPNALPWDSIRPANYQTLLNIAAYVPQINARHEERVRNNEEFAIFENDIARYHELKEQNTLSVNLEERRRLKAADDALALKNTNVRLKHMGKSPVKAVKDLPEDFQFDDPILDETLNVASDYADLIAGAGVSAGNTPILSRFARPEEE